MAEPDQHDIEPETDLRLVGLKQPILLQRAQDRLPELVVADIRVFGIGLPAADILQADGAAQRRAQCELGFPCRYGRHAVRAHRRRSASTEAAQCCDQQRLNHRAAQHFPLLPGTAMKAPSRHRSMRCGDAAVIVHGIELCRACSSSRVVKAPLRPSWEADAMLAHPASVLRPRDTISQAELEQILRKSDLYHQARPGGQRALLAYRDLTGAQLGGRDLSDADLSAAFLCDANLEGANLNGATLFGCNLSRANLRNASLVRADLRGACLREAHMTGANLFDCDLRDGRLARKTRSGEIEYIAVEPDSTVLVGATMINANLTQARLSGSVAVHTDFTDAMMRDTKLVRADLRNAVMNGANLENADLSGANLKGASLRNAVLVNTALIDVETEAADMTGALTKSEAGRSVEELGEAVEERLRRHELWATTDGADGEPLDITGFDLRKIEGGLPRRQLSALVGFNAVLYGMNLEGIALQAAQLEGADLRGCRLANADLRGINLKGARMNYADLRDCNLAPLMLANGRMIQSKLEGIDGRHADFRGANLKRAVFRGANLSAANLTGARLEGIDLADANL